MKHNYANNIWVKLTQGAHLGKSSMACFGVLFLMFFASLSVVGQNPNYTYDPSNSKNLDFFSVTIADAANIQAKLNRLIIAVAIGPNGDQFVLTFGNGIKKVGTSGGLVDFIPNTSDRLSNALDFAINSDGKFFVATNESNRRFVRVYSSSGAYLQNETLGDGSYGYTANQFKGPTGLTFDKDDNLYVADHYIGDQDPPVPSAIKIYKKDASGNYKNNLINQFDNIGGTLLNFPFRLAVNSQRQLYVSELGQETTANVKVFQLDSDFKPTKIDQIGGTSSQIGAPGSIIIDKFDNIFIADFGNEINLPRLLEATDDPNEFAKVFDIIKKGIQNNVFKINIYNPDNTFKSIITDGIDFPIDLAISKCGTLYVNNSIFDGKFTELCFPFIGCTPIPDITLDFDLEVYQRSAGYDTDKPILISCPADITADVDSGKNFATVTFNTPTATDNCSTPTVVQTKGPASGSQFQAGTTTEIEFTATDASGNKFSCSFTITVNEVVGSNTAPVANNDDNYSTSQDVVLSIAAPGVLSNDTDADDDALTAIIQTQTTNGTVSLNTDGSFTYTPDNGYFGTDTFTYVANDGTENSNIATVTITVNEVIVPNTAPVANNDDNYNTNQEVVLNIAAPGVLSNDTDADGDSLTAIIQSQTTNGTVSLNLDGSFTYTPDNGYFGTDAFTYVANDGELNSDVATVTITVNEVIVPNTAPVANNDDNYSTNQDVVLSIAAPGVLSNDTDADGDSLTAIIQSQTTNGTVSLNSDGSFTYTPDNGYFGTDAFTYIANDGTENSNLATVTITVNEVVPPNTTPVANDDTYTIDKDQTLDITAPGILVNDIDAENDLLSPVEPTFPSNGTLLSFSSDGSFTYVPNDGFIGVDTFTYMVNDGSLNSNVATITINVIDTGVPNTAPVAFDDFYSTNVNETFSLPPSGVLSNDIDSENDPLTAVIQTAPAHGLLEFNADGSLIFIPDENFIGIDSFTYVANDGTLNSNIATITINVGNSATNNFAPIASDDTYSIDQDMTLSISIPGVLGNDTDEDGDLLTAIIQSQTTNGMVSLNADGSFTYTPDNGYFGADTFTYLANDGELNSDVATVTITVNDTSLPNTPPVAINNSYTIAQDMTLSIISPGVLGNDIDADVDELIAVIQSQPTSGTLTLNSDGSFIYVPNSGFTGEDSFTYTANDGSSNSNIATVSITVFTTTNTNVTCKESVTLELDESGIAILNAEGLFTSRPVNLQFSVDKEIFSCDEIGENTVTLSYSNNEIQGSCEVKIIVKDVTPPIVKVKDISVILNEFGSVNITPEMLDNGSTDNCGDLSFSLSQLSFSCKELGENVVTFTAIDPSGNSTNTTATVTVTGDCSFNPTPEVEFIYIYPNPSSGPFKFVTPAGVTIQRVEVFDFRGRMILFKDFAETELQYDMDLTGVQSAVYLLKLFTSEGIDIKRVIIN